MSPTPPPPPCRVGTAGWWFPGELPDPFPGKGPFLARYARRFDAVEINTSFYRPPRPETYLKWAGLVPEGFRFAVKLFRGFTHFQRLGPGGDLEGFLAGAALLGSRLGPLLVQLPPRLGFQAGTAGAFLERLRALHAGGVVWEPRHPSWFGPEPEALLRSFQVARVAADPAVTPAAAEPGGWDGLVYYRLHGSPERYVSPYGPAYAAQLAERIRRLPVPCWCVFDNTARGAATVDALGLLERLGRARPQPPAQPGLAFDP